MDKDKEHIYILIFITFILLIIESMGKKKEIDEMPDYHELMLLNKEQLSELLSIHEKNENYEYCQLIVNILKAKYGKYKK